MFYVIQPTHKTNSKRNKISKSFNNNVRNWSKTIILLDPTQKKKT